MISALILNGVLKVLSIRRDSNQLRARCRVYSLTSQVPEEVLFEDTPGSGEFTHPSGKKFRADIQREIVVPV
jgi:hypothetical protein